jgi:hypothetical protein
MSQAAETVNSLPRPAMLPDPTQLELLRGPDGALPRAAIHRVRGVGRPPGAKNKRSKRVADYFVAKYGDPLDVLGQLMNTPLRQLVEVLIEAEGGEEREQRLLGAVDEAVDAIKALRRVKGANISDVAGDLADAIEKLARVAEQLNGGKPGKLALDALALQIQATVRALEYVHGKQPIALDLRKSADVVLVAPELLKEFGIDPQALADQIASGGLESLDPDTLRLVDRRVEDGEFNEVGPDDETDETGGAND